MNKDEEDDMTDEQWVKNSKARAKMDVEMMQKCIDMGLLDDILKERKQHGTNKQSRNKLRSERIH